MRRSKNMETAHKTSGVSSTRLMTVLLITWLAVLLAIRGIIALTAFVPVLAQVSGALTAILLLYPAVWFADPRAPGENFWSYDRQSLWRAGIWFLGAFAILPFIIVLDAGTGGQLADLHWRSWPAARWFDQILTQILVVAMPEEFFFRGFMQPRLARIYPPKRTIFGVPFGKAHVLTAFLFAISHSVITFQGWHVFIFFPGLVFGWLKEKTDTVWAGALFHAACNLFSFALFLGPDSLAYRIGTAVAQFVVKSLS